MSAGLRDEVIRVAREISSSGLSEGTSGNVSVRIDGGFLITPSAVPYDELETPSIVRMSLEGDVLGAGKPSSEWRFHRDIYRARDDVRAVVHTHSAHATALACHGRDIPPFHYMVAVAGGTAIRCAPYAQFGTQELSDQVVEALGEQRACLLANHGAIAVGTSLDAALHLAREVETLARQYLLSSTLGAPTLLDDEQMSAVLEAFKDYGKPS